MPSDMDKDEEIILSKHERDAFFDALLIPQLPSKKAMAAAQRYREIMEMPPQEPGE